MTGFAARITAWQKKRGRHDLPWQGTRDPYAIWVSEIMLQQTQVGTVIPYYSRFLARFPDVAALAAAPLDEVLRLWSGLGYYSRARNLHGAAQEIVAAHGGRFPRRFEQVAALPGIGRSTAAALCVFAYGARHAILDGNVKRVLARFAGIKGYPGEKKVADALWRKAERLLPRRGIEAYTQGLMDLGATLCVRARPRCDECPVATTCAAREQGRTEALPAPRPARARPVRHATIVIVRDCSGALLLEARPPTGIWGGLVSLPEFDADADDHQLIAAIAERYALQVDLGERLPHLRHEFSHYTLVMHPRIAGVRRALGAASAASQWVGTDALRTAALPAPVRRLLLEHCGET